MPTFETLIEENLTEEEFFEELNIIDKEFEELMPMPSMKEGRNSNARTKDKSLKRRQKNLRCIKERRQIANEPEEESPQEEVKEGLNKKKSKKKV